MGQSLFTVYKPCHALAYIQFSCGSVAYFAPDAPDFQEAGELKGDDLDKALRVLDARGVPGDKSRVERIKGPFS